MKEITKNQRLMCGLKNIMAMAVVNAREDERDRLYKLFIAQQPRLQDKAEFIIMLEQVINQYLDLRFDLRPQLIALKENSNMSEYRRTYSLILKMEDCIGRTLGRLGLSLTPQKYIPTDERETFDPKAVAELKHKVGKFAEGVKAKKKEEKPAEAKTK